MFFNFCFHFLSYLKCTFVSFIFFRMSSYVLLLKEIDRSYKTKTEEPAILPQYLLPSRVRQKQSFLILESLDACEFLHFI